MGGNPLNTIDPLGLDWVVIDGVRQWVDGDNVIISDGSDQFSDRRAMADLINEALTDGRLTSDEAMTVSDGLLSIPKPGPESHFVQKLSTVFNEAIFQLENNPDYGGSASLVAFVQRLNTNAPIIAGMLATFAAIQYLPPPWNVGIDTVLFAAGIAMTGAEGVMFMTSFIELAMRIDETDICDGNRLAELGEEFAADIHDAGLSIAEGALLGGMGAIGNLSRHFPSLNGRERNRDDLEELSDDIADDMADDLARQAGADGRFSPEQPLDANGNPIIRTNDRGSIQIQPNGSVTCGQHSCGMVLNTQGNPVAVDDLIRSHPPNVPGEGTTPDQLQRLLRDNGINSVYRPFASIDALSRWTSQGRPAIATVRTGPETYHAVVVDGVTTRGGQTVVAIRDPGGRVNGGVYYETVSSFRNRFTGEVIRIVP